MTQKALKKFREHAEARDFSALEEMLADDVVLYSPAHAEPMNGRSFAALCITSALDILHQGAFRFTREFVSNSGGVVEFVSDINGTLINGSDMLTVNAEGKITEFKVMVRPREVGDRFCDMMSEKMATLLKAAG